eukprot:453216-Prorocentrum_minimum.AAC.1
MGGEAVYAQRENQPQEGRRYIPSARTNRRREASQLAAAPTTSGGGARGIRHRSVNRGGLEEV